MVTNENYYITLSHDPVLSNGENMYMLFFNLNPSLFSFDDSGGLQL